MQGECTEILSRSIARAITLKDLLHDVYPRLGRVYSAIGNHPRAAREFAKAVQTRPNDSTLWRELGTAQLQSDQPAAAIESLDRSLILDPYQPQVLYDLARSHSRIEETDRAIHDLRHSISRGFSDFTVIERDDGFSRLRGDARFEEIVYHGPASVY